MLIRMLLIMALFISSSIVLQPADLVYELSRRDDKDMEELVKRLVNSLKMSDAQLHWIKV